MSEIHFNCPQCDQAFDAPAEMAGTSTVCPSCQNEFHVPGWDSTGGSVPAAVPETQYPIVVYSSTRALYAKYTVRGAFYFSALVLLFLACQRFAESPLVVFAGSAWFVLFLLAIVSAIRFWLDRRRLKNTKYLIFPGKIEAASYLFKFLGVYNNTINIAQLKQIQTFRNSLLDVWFFGCGKITLTVSGDVADFELTNIHLPEVVRSQIEEIAFGDKSKVRKS